MNLTCIASLKAPSVFHSLYASAFASGHKRGSPAVVSPAALRRDIKSVLSTTGEFGRTLTTTVNSVRSAIKDQATRIEVATEMLTPGLRSSISSATDIVVESQNTNHLAVPELVNNSSTGLQASQDSLREELQAAAKQLTETHDKAQKKPSST